MNEDHPDHPSNYKGKVFDATSSRLFTKTKSYANPLYLGTDIEALNQINERIEQLQEDGEIPSSYDIHNPVQLLPERTFDTTNRASVVGAQKNAFDPDGFKSGRPLQRTIFYLDPFVTCQWCNMVTFVDVMAIRRSLAMPDDISKSLNLDLESLPPCRKCNKAEFLVVGSHDFTDLIANRDKEEKKKRARQLKAALLIQKNFREYLRKAYARAAAAARLALKKLQAKAATRINACARYRLAQRRALAEYHLRVIKTSNPVLLAHALKKPKKPDRRFNWQTKTFWFERKVELDFVFRDYIGLSERLGWNPARKAMEVNFIELSKRITARKDDLLSLVQRAWRGFMARRIVMYYRTEVIRLKQFLLSKAFKIQRLWRGHRVRLHIMPKLRYDKQREESENDYFEFREKKMKKKRREDAITMTKNAYIKERAEERTVRYTGRIDVATDHQDRKMRAFAASCYSDNRLQDQMDSLLETDMMEVAEFKAKVQEDHDRKEFILNRIKETGPEGYGLRSEMPHISTQKVMHGIAVGPERMPPRSASMKKLLYSEVTEIMEGVIERATHNFEIPNLMGRLKEFNAERPVGKREKGTKAVKANLKNKEPKITEPLLGGLMESMKTSPLMSKRERKTMKDADDDLGGTGSAFDVSYVDSDGDGSDIDDDMSAISLSSAGGGSRTKGKKGAQNPSLSSPLARKGSEKTLIRPDSKSKLRFKNAGMGNNGLAKGKGKNQHRFFKDYKFPTGINENPMDFLNEDMDIILAYSDAKAKEKQAKLVEEDNGKTQLRSKERKKGQM